MSTTNPLKLGTVLGTILIFLAFVIGSGWLAVTAAFEFLLGLFNREEG